MFCNMQQLLLKAVYWDRTGFCGSSSHRGRETAPAHETETTAGVAAAGGAADRPSGAGQAVCVRSFVGAHRRGLRTITWTSASATSSDRSRAAGYLLPVAPGSPHLVGPSAQAASGSRGAGPPGSDGRHDLGRTVGFRRRARCREAIRATTDTSTASSVTATPTIVSISRGPERMNTHGAGYRGLAGCRPQPVSHARALASAKASRPYATRQPLHHHRWIRTL